MKGKSLGDHIEINPEHKLPGSNSDAFSKEHSDPPPSKCPQNDATAELQLSSAPSTTVQHVAKPLKQATVVEFRRKACIKNLKDQLDFDTMLFICISGIAPLRVDLPEWKTLWKHGNPDYIPASAAVLTDVHIPNEAAHISLLQLAYLQTWDNLTITFNGNSTKRHNLTYMFHVWTPDRCMFLFEADESSLESHTGVKLVNVLKGVILSTIVLVIKRHFHTELMTDN